MLHSSSSSKFVLKLQTEVMARYESGLAVMADGDRPVYSGASDPVIHPFEEG